MRYFEMFSSLIREIPQPVFFLSSLPCISSLNEDVTSKISIMISIRRCGAPLRLPLYGCGLPISQGSWVILEDCIMSFKSSRHINTYILYNILQKKSTAFWKNSSAIILKLIFLEKITKCYWFFCRKYHAAVQRNFGFYSAWLHGKSDRKMAV